MFVYIIILILISIVIIIESKKSLHMLQQNLYNENNRYLKWNAKNKNNLLTNEFVVKNDGVTNLSYTIYDKAGNETNCEPVELKKDYTTYMWWN